MKIFFYYINLDSSRINKKLKISKCKTYPLNFENLNLNKRKSNYTCKKISNNNKIIISTHINILSILYTPQLKINFYFENKVI